MKPLSRTCAWNHGICMCDHASTITHVDRIKKSSLLHHGMTVMTVMSLLKCNYSINVSLWHSVIFIDIFTISNYLVKHCTFSHFSTYRQSLIQLTFGQLWQQAGTLVIQNNDASNMTTVLRALVRIWFVDLAFMHHMFNINLAETRNSMQNRLTYSFVIVWIHIIPLLQ